MPKLIANDYKNFTGLEAEDNVSLSINLPYVGDYLIIFAISHCGANSLSDTNAYWSFSGTLPNGTANLYLPNRTTLSLVIPHTWDQNATTAVITGTTIAGVHTFRATNHTGKTTDTRYASTFYVGAIYLP